MTRPYRFNGGRIIGMERNGVEYSSIIWASMTPSVSKNLGLKETCRDLGTETCLNCTEQIADEDCSFECEDCVHKNKCPCSLEGWEARAPQKERV